MASAGNFWYTIGTPMATLATYSSTQDRIHSSSQFGYGSTWTGAIESVTAYINMYISNSGGCTATGGVLTA
ncbi:MAG: hypothetical protein ACRECH_16455 [Nitrososphaerales archaeon]